MSGRDDDLPCTVTQCSSAPHSLTMTMQALRPVRRPMSADDCKGVVGAGIALIKIDGLDGGLHPFLQISSWVLCPAIGNDPARAGNLPAPSGFVAAPSGGFGGLLRT